MDDDVYGAFDWWIRTRIFRWAQGLSILVAGLAVLLTFLGGHNLSRFWAVVIACIACIWTSLSVTVVTWLRMIVTGILLEASLRRRHMTPQWQGVKVIGWPGAAAFRILLASGVTLMLGYLSICLAYAVAYSTIDGLTASGFSTAFYFSIIAASTVGFGDVSPVGAGRLLVVLQVLSGVMYVIMAFGASSTIFSRVVSGLAPGLGVEQSNGEVVIPGVFIEEQGMKRDPRE
jgi:hypothetical protein